METIVLRDYCAEQGFTQIAKKIRANVNGYKYITFSRSETDSENIYLAKSLDESTTVGQAIDKDLLKSLQIVHTTNAAGEVRTKLCSKGERLDLADLWD
jgi:hypothetical protein